MFAEENILFFLFFFLPTCICRHHQRTCIGKVNTFYVSPVKHLPARVLNCDAAEMNNKSLTVVTFFFHNVCGLETDGPISITFVTKFDMNVIHSSLCRDCLYFAVIDMRYYPSYNFV